MSHYTLGMRSNPELRGLAREANRARSAAFKDVFLALGRFFFPRRLSNLPQ